MKTDQIAVKRTGTGVRMFRATAVLVAAVVVIHLASMLTLDRMLQYKEITYHSSRVDEALDGYRIVFLTDIHDLPEDKMQKMVEEINTRGLDLLVMGGDFPGGESLARCVEILSGIVASDGAYSVAGNHDGQRWFGEALAQQGMTLLANEGVAVRDGLYLAGTEDLWGGDPDVGAATAGARPDDFVLLLAHQPDTTMRYDFSDVDLALSGHTHGGQITMFGLWAPAVPRVSSYGQRFQSGWCKSGADTDVFVSRGVWHPKKLIRVFSRPQVVILTLRSEL